MLILVCLLLLFPLHSPCHSSPITELDLLLQIKASLDPQDKFLTSWTSDSDPCTGSFEGVACNEFGNVANISLQGKGLSGSLPAALGGLRNLTGLYLHFNTLNGEIPAEVSQLSQLSDLYLNVNNLSGEIPPQIGNMPNLQVLQLCYNKLTGSIPTQLGSLNKLSVLALQYNQLTGAIPASLGNLESLTRLDVSFNNLFGSVPLKLADAPLLEVLDIRNNTLSGNVPLALKRLNSGFQYGNNPGLCGAGFPQLNVCTASGQLDPYRPEPFKPNGSLTRDIPVSVNLPSNCTEAHCSNPSKIPKIGVISGVVGVFILLTITGIFAFSWHRRQKQKIGSAFDSSDGRLSTDQAKEVYRKSASPLISLEYSNGWDPLAKGRCGNGFSQEVLEGFMFNLEEVERATQCFSEVNLLGKSNFSATYKGILRDGSVVAIKCIAKSSCKSDEAEFLKGLKILISLKQENLVRLRGICCSKGRGECFLIYDFVPNGNLLQYLDVKEGSDKVLDWSTRISIINGIAKGIGHLHGNKGSKSALVHQNISAEKVFMDGQYNPLLSESGFHKLLADDIVFSNLKASAAMGYLAPEYTTTGRFTEKSDVYAFGMLIFQILSGKREISHLTRHATESGKFEDFIDRNLEGKFSESEAATLGIIAISCTHESPDYRPSLATVTQELSGLSGNL
ncbi:LRR receptor-like serine/threonine-protein kinase [Tripterygium wilfordii]|uniref:LRR receptor-like serine/threonine-protein kinase n=1 Tax=Tripterygium wilfordii TaxID=458696 RepID=A0A7J7CC56_TRIWF|nr:leucine-rich repeat receptor protein kinase EMS1-like [Tripterygium wilfordii]KAF5731660.1 LRR receptor-like serine/threonine-protein kinase [Tripterygium wilfordii]